MVVELIVFLLLGISSVMTFKYSYGALKAFKTSRFSCIRNEITMRMSSKYSDSINELRNETNDYIKLVAPAIFSKQLLFGHGNSEVVSANDEILALEDDTEYTSSKIKGRY
jgi:hypothetical protein